MYLPSYFFFIKGHERVADKSVVSGSGVIGFAMARLGSVTFVAYCRIFHVAHTQLCVKTELGDLGLMDTEKFYFLKLFLLFTNALSQWDFSHGKFRLPSPGNASCDSRATQHMVHAGCFSVSIVHQTLTWTMGFLKCAQM